MLSQAFSLAVAVGVIGSIAAIPPQRAGLRTSPVSRSASESHSARARGTADDPPVLGLDDGSYEDVAGVVSADRRSGFQAVYLNRFTPDPALLPFTLDTVSVLLPVGIGNFPTGLSAGQPFDVLVFADPSGSGDPANAALVLQQPFAIAPDNAIFQDVRLSTAVVIQSGDVWVGFTNTVTATDDLPIYPVALDTNGAPAGRSWVFFDREPPGHFNGPLATASARALLESNMLIRASGQTGGNTRVCWSAPGSARVEGGGGPPPVNTRICGFVPPFPKVEEVGGATGTLLGYNVYRSNQTGVQPTPSNLFTSTPPTQTSASTSVSPSGSFFVITAVYDTGESAPSDELAIVPATITSLDVKSTKIVAKGANFADGLQVFVDGIPYVNPAVLKKNGTKMIQKGPLLTGQTIDAYLAAHGGQARMTMRNVDGSFTTRSLVP